MLLTTTTGCDDHTDRAGVRARGACCGCGGGFRAKASWAIQHASFTYATLDFAISTSCTNGRVGCRSGCQVIPLMVPEGWEIAPGELAVVTGVIAQYPWGTSYLVTAEGAQWRTYGHKPHDRGTPRRSAGMLDCDPVSGCLPRDDGRCESRVLMRRQGSILGKQLAWPSLLPSAAWPPAFFACAAAVLLGLATLWSKRRFARTCRSARTLDHLVARAEAEEEELFHLEVVEEAATATLRSSRTGEHLEIGLLEFG